MNPIEFNPGELIMSIYTGKIYEVYSHKNGMSKLENKTTGRLEDWNSYNNPHFTKAQNQLTLF